MHSTTLTPHERRVIGAFKLAYRELDIPDHPDGKCPAADCPCASVHPGAIEKRAAELLADPDIEDSQPCEDCSDVMCTICGKPVTQSLADLGEHRHPHCMTP